MPIGPPTECSLGTNSDRVKTSYSLFFAPPAPPWFFWGQSGEPWEIKMERGHHKNKRCVIIATLPQGTNAICPDQWIRLRQFRIGRSLAQATVAEDWNLPQTTAAVAVALFCQCPHKDGWCKSTPHCADMKHLWEHMEGTNVKLHTIFCHMKF